MTTDPAESATRAPVQVLRGRVVLEDSVIDDGAVLVEGRSISWAGPASAVPAAGVPERTAAWVLPGLVDVHNHGGGGEGFPDADLAGCRAAVDAHRSQGTTTMLASLVSAPAGVLEERVELLAGLVAEGEVAGIHLEGPFLSPQRRGAHDPDAVVPGDPRLVETLVRAGGGAVRSMTIAPEVDGYTEVLRLLRDHDVLPSLGHTDAPSPVFSQGVRAALPGRLSVTHLFNAMSPFDHRSPGAVPAALRAAADGELVVELIADGVHLDPETVAAVYALVGPDRIALVSDAMSAAGMDDGSYRLGSLDVVVADGVARLATGEGEAPGAIAGGTASLLDIVRSTVAVGVPLVSAVRSASSVPAALVGLDGEVGRIAPGLAADLLLLDDDLSLEAVMRRGELLSRNQPQGRKAV